MNLRCRVLTVFISCAVVCAVSPARAGEAEYRSLGDQAKKYFDERNYLKSLELNRLLVAEAERSFGPEHPLTLRAMSYLALNLSANLLHDESIEVNRRLLAVLEKLGSSLDAATARNNIAGEYRSTGRYAQAAEQVRRVLAVREQQLGPEHPQTADALNFLALDLKQLGSYADAEPLFRRAIAAWEKSGSANRVYGLNNLALLLSQQGRYAEAEPHYRRALELSEGAKGFEAGAAMVSANYAAALGNQGRDAEAENLLRRSLAFRESSLGPSHFGTAQTLRNLAGAVQAQGKYREAETMLQRALQILQAARGPEDLDAAKAKHSLAVVLNSQNRYREAEPYARESLAVFERLLGPEHPETAEKMGAYARVLLETGESRQALALYLRARANLRQAGSPRALLVAASEVAHVLHASGLLEPALPFYRETIDALDNLFAQTRGLSEETRYSFLRQYAYIYGHFIQLLLELHAKQPGAGHDRETLAVVSRNQSRIFAEMLRQSDVAKFARDPAFVALKREREELIAQTAALRAARAAIGLAEREAQTRRANLAASVSGLEQRLAQAEARLWREFPRFMELSQPRPVTADDLQSRLLKPGEALLNFVLLPDQAVVFAVTRQRFVMQVRSVKREEIGRRVAAARKSAEQLAAGASPAILRSLDPGDLYFLYRELVAPVEDLLKSSKRVLVIGDGPLNTLPLEMLVVDFDSGARQRFEDARAGADGQPGRALLSEYGKLAYLGERHRFAYLPSLPALVSQRLYPKADVKYQTQLVSFADPVFESEGQPYGEVTRSALVELSANRSLRSSGPGISIPRLPETADEARAVARALGGKSETYVRDQAQERRLKTIDLKNVRYLHFATHGFLGGEFVLVKEALQAGSLGSASSGASRNLQVAALSQAVTGPSRPSAGGQPAIALSLVGNLQGEDGLLTMQEVIEDLDLNAQLVVLSACNTAGETAGAANGEGFAGLTRGFMFAGAKGLLVSHWAVDSAATTELISETFRQIQAGQPAYEALQRARAAVRGSCDQAGRLNYSREHPYFWAPFVYVGD